MDTFFFNFIDYLFFPLSLAGSLSFFGIIAQNELSGTDTVNRRTTKEQANLFILGVLLSIMIGFWISFTLYLSLIGIPKIFSYPLPSLSIFLLNFLICSSLSFSVPPILPLFYNSLLLGFSQAVIGSFAHSGFTYIYNLPGELFSHIPFLPLSLFGILLGLILRTVWFQFKGA